MVSAPDFFDLLLMHDGYYEIKQTLFSYLSRADVARLYSHHRPDDFKCAIPGNVDIAGHLSRYFHKPNSFRSMMAKHGALVFGRDVLRFLEGLLWKGSALEGYMAKDFEGSVMELYVPEAGTEEFVRYLIEREGYEFKRQGWQGPGAASRGVLGTNLKKGRNVKILREYINLNTTDSGKEDVGLAEHVLEMLNVSGFFVLQRPDGLKVHVIASTFNPAAIVINSGYHTCLGNFYTWNRCYSLFPELTFDRRLRIVVKIPKTPNYFNHSGYDAVLDVDINTTYPGMTGHRRVADRHSWCLSLDTSAVRLPKNKPTVPDYIFSYATFTVASHRKAFPRFRNDGSIYEHLIWRFKIGTTIISRSILQHDWLVPSQGRWYKSFCPLVERAELAARQQFENSEYKGVLQDWHYVFPKPLPKDFKYADEKIPAWYDKWSEEFSGGIDAIPSRVWDVLISCDYEGYS